MGPGGEESQPGQLTQIIGGLIALSSVFMGYLIAKHYGGGSAVRGLQRLTYGGGGGGGGRQTGRAINTKLSRNAAFGFGGGAAVSSMSSFKPQQNAMSTFADPYGQQQGAYGAYEPSPEPDRRMFDVRPSQSPYGDWLNARGSFLPPASVAEAAVVAAERARSQTGSQMGSQRGGGMAASQVGSQRSGSSQVSASQVSRSQRSGSQASSSQAYASQTSTSQRGGPQDGGRQMISGSVLSGSYVSQNPMGAAAMGAQTMPDRERESYLSGSYVSSSSRSRSDNGSSAASGSGLGSRPGDRAVSSSSQDVLAELARRRAAANAATAS
jgi:hypothetical protein